MEVLQTLFIIIIIIIIINFIHNKKLFTSSREGLSTSCVGDIPRSRNGAARASSFNTARRLYSGMSRILRSKD